MLVLLEIALVSSLLTAGITMNSPLLFITGLALILISYAVNDIVLGNIFGGNL